MNPGHLKGSLLEYLIRQLLQNCGFASVKPDGHYIYEHGSSGLFYINGKGAAHDADVLMEPPIQLPFSYPSRLLFECKAYKTRVGLSAIRNALGLRYDINEFEIVTDESIERRKNNLRADYAISDRKRFHYQVGVATIEEFSPAAFEFAANNKIPLFSISWFLSNQIYTLFNEIDFEYINRIHPILRTNLYRFFKDKEQQAYYKYEGVDNFISDDAVIGRIVRSFRAVIERTLIGLIETGDLIFLYSPNDSNFNFLANPNNLGGLRARIHYLRERPNEWELELHDFQNISKFKFVVPYSIMETWKKYCLDKHVGYDIKAKYFSRIFIFPGHRQLSLPFVTLNIDEEWLQNLS